jgi:ribosomal protein L40E
MGYALQLAIANLTLTNEYPSGHVVSSSPLTCQEFANMPESTTCGVAFTTQPSGSELVEFAMTLPSAGTYTTLAATALFYSQGQILKGSFSIQYLTITVTSPSSSPSTSLQSSGTVSGTASISNFQYPTTVLLGQQAIVSFTVSFSGFTPGVTYLVVGVQNADGSGWAPGSVVSSSPDNCPHPTEQDRGLAVCFYQPVESQGSENLAFSLTVNPTVTFSSSGAEAVPALSSTSCSSDWCFGQSQYTSSFTIQAVTSLSPSSQQTGGTDYSVLLLCFAIAAVVIFIIWFGLVRGPKAKPAEQQVQQAGTKPSEVNKVSEVKVSDKQFCLECGSELPLGSKFCNKCGSKQQR